MYFAVKRKALVFWVSVVKAVTVEGSQKDLPLRLTGAKSTVAVPRTD